MEKTVTAEFKPSGELLCPECGWLMLYTSVKGDMVVCSNMACKHYSVVFKLPKTTVLLEVYCDHPFAHRMVQYERTADDGKITSCRTVRHFCSKCDQTLPENLPMFIQ